MEETRFYVGMRITKDGYIRHELLPDGRFDEARRNRKNACQGKYTITENHIDYINDTDFAADGDFKNGILYHARMVLYKEEQRNYTSSIYSSKKSKENVRPNAYNKSLTTEI